MNDAAHAKVMQSMTVGRKPEGRRSLERFLTENRIDDLHGAPVDLIADDPWMVQDDRAAGRVLHGFVFLRSWIAWLDDPALPNAGRAAIDLMARWHRLHGERSASAGTLAYHDETTAQRLISLLLLHAATRDSVPEHQSEFLVERMVETSDLLLQDGFHATGNNHGMFQDIALRNYAVVRNWPDALSDEKLDRSFERLDAYFASAFTADGVHIENAPTYHLMIARSLAEHLTIARALGRLASERALAGLLDRAARYATHAVLPSGVFWPLSDSRQLPLDSPQHNPFASSTFEYAATAGRRGEVPSSRVLSLPNSGYFFARASWEDPASAYLAFTAAYHGDYHKHSDDLALYLWRAGAPILSEAGPYGYDYAKPLTKYAYSQFAHNNLVVNERSVPRTDRHSDTVWMSEATTVADGATQVTAGTMRLEGAYHERTLTVDDALEDIVVVDRVRALQRNVYDVHWNTAPDTLVVLRPDGFELFRNGKKVADAAIASDRPVEVTAHRGEMRPQVLGWHFPKFGEAKPATTLRVRVTGEDLDLTTHFRTAEPFNYRDRGVQRSGSNWRRSNSAPTINALLERRSSTKLCVVFPAEAEQGDFPYNYRDIMAESGLNALHVLDDFGRHGAAHWLHHGTARPFQAVQDTIKRTLEELDIDSPDDVIMVGAGKGGLAAMLHGASLGVGAVIASAPPFRFGTWLLRSNPDALQYLTRGRSNAHAKHLDRLVQETLATEAGPKRLSIFAGGASGNTATDLPALEQGLERLGWNHEVIVRDDMSFSSVGKPFRSLLLEAVSAFSNERFESLLTSGCALSHRDGVTNLSLPDVLGYQYSVKLFRDEQLVAESVYSESRNVSWEASEPGSYRARIFARMGGRRALPQSTPRLRVSS